MRMDMLITDIVTEFVIAKNPLARKPEGSLLRQHFLDSSLRSK
jgi:hypothetical protein